MALFGRKDERDTQIEALIEENKKIRKRSAALLAEESARSSELSTQVDLLKGEVEELKAALKKLRLRQKASVERANRYKSRLMSSGLHQTR